MQTDRTTKTLLFLIAVALWGLLLRPLFAPVPGAAQGLVTPVHIVSVDGGSLPVAITRQTVPVEVKAARSFVLPVEITGQQAVISVKPAP